MSGYEYVVAKQYMDLVKTILLGIRHELDVWYWNKNQEKMISPFDNTAAEYENETFRVSAYDWRTDDLDDGVDGRVLPNFKYKGFKLWWYKHAGRGMHAVCDIPVNAEYLHMMHDDCIASIRRDFGACMDTGADDTDD